MKRLQLAAVSAACTLLMGASISFAQDGPPSFRPVEMWVCNFNEGQDQGDLDKVYKGIVELTGDAKYAAFQLDPYFVNANQDFDVIYLGAWANGSTMGSDLANAMENGGGVSDAWNKVLNCPTSVMYASTWLNQPDNGAGNGEALLTVADCHVAHGASNAQAAGALRRYNEYAVAHGSDLGTILWYPAFGHGDAGFDFKLATVFPGAKQFGDWFQWFTDNQVYNVRSDLLDGIVSCDSSRVYTARTIMNNIQ